MSGELHCYIYQSIISNLARLYIFWEIYSTRIDNYLQHWFVHGDNSIDSVISMIAHSFNKVIRDLIQVDLMFADYKSVEYYCAISEKWSKLLVKKTLHEQKHDCTGSTRVFVVSEIPYVAIEKYTRSVPLARLLNIRYSVNPKTVLRASCACKAEFHRHVSHPCRSARMSFIGEI